MTAEPEFSSILARACAALRSDGLVCYPTETVYGLAAAIDSAEALQELAEVKGRDAEKAFSVLVPDIRVARGLLAGPVAEQVQLLADAFWPGPLTIVARAAHGLDRRLVGESGGVGLRCSPDPVAAALSSALGAAITSTSANPAGQKPAQSVAEARAYFGDRVAEYLDGGRRGAEPVSTVVEVSAEGMRVLRAGAISEQALASVLRRG